MSHLRGVGQECRTGILGMRGGVSALGWGRGEAHGGGRAWVLASSSREPAGTLLSTPISQREGMSQVSVHSFVNEETEAESYYARVRARRGWGPEFPKFSTWGFVPAPYVRQNPPKKQKNKKNPHLSVGMVTVGVTTDTVPGHWVCESSGPQ